MDASRYHAATTKKKYLNPGHGADCATYMGDGARWRQPAA